MKLLLCILLVANLVFFVWQSMVGQSAGAADIVLLAGEVGEKKDGLTLLGETSGNREPPGVSGEGQAAPMCVQLGPFKRLLDAEYVNESLQDQDIAASISVIPQLTTINRVAFIGADKLKGATESELLGEMHHLRTEGIETFLAELPDGSPALALGVFDDVVGVSQQITQLDSLGYSVAIKEHPLLDESIQVVLSVQEAAKLDQKSWVTLLSRYDGVEKQFFYCLGVASR